jgi:hypothetical protein
VILHRPKIRYGEDLPNDVIGGFVAADGKPTRVTPIKCILLAPEDDGGVE